MNAAQYASQLIRFDSVSSKSNVAICEHVDSVLTLLGFDTERIEYVVDGVTKANVIGRRKPDATDKVSSGGIANFGHTDVVPADDWSIKDHGPFDPTVRDQRLYGRGSTDMKGSIACMLAAAESLKDQKLTRPIYICCSADEELDHQGIKQVAQHSELYRDLVNQKACAIVGEPTGMNVVYAHKGGVQMTCTSVGKAAHSSSRQGVNANWAMIPFLADVKAIYEQTQSDPNWLNEEFDPPTVCLNICVNDHTAAVNITSPQSVCKMHFRPMPGTDADGLVNLLRDAAERSGVRFSVTAENPSFRRDPSGEFAAECVKICGSNPPRTVAYGSEAGNLDQVDQVVVLGPGNIDQAHKSNEWISLEQLQRGTDCYRDILQQRCLG